MVCVVSGTIGFATFYFAYIFYSFVLHAKPRNDQDHVLF